MGSVVAAGANYLAGQAEGRQRSEAMAQYLNELRGYLVGEQAAADEDARSMQGFSREARDASGRLIDSRGAPMRNARTRASAQFEAGASADVAPGQIPGMTLPALAQQRAAVSRFTPEVDSYRTILSNDVGNAAGDTFGANADTLYAHDTGITGSNAKFYGYGSDVKRANRKRAWTLREAQLKAQLGEGSNAAANLRLLGAVGGAGENAAMGSILG
ncbi:hypothetical protein UFOVP141_51 [uncultured Caudovirales phage]|uniref:Uncharacterized protein n=1 Tax=uncultured Caudovirales phage TaxID=2100421 RepID=A0A6J7VLA1_9CAUD|nr:hypothetical protein UFOVP141_51 [uncultured Caudovirales phage]